MPKFFINPEDVGEKIYLAGDNYHHGAKVLRLKKGDKLTLCDGSLNDYEAEVAEITENNIVCDIISTKENDREPKLQITLFQGLPKGDKMSLICEKCVEAGVLRIVPVALDRCVVKLTPKEYEKKRERLSKVMLSASKQSGRGVVAEIAPLCSFKEMLEKIGDYDLFLFPYELEDKTSLKSQIKGFSGKKIALIIGPEGGFSVKEAEGLISAGAKSVSLGKRILRTETAGMATIFNILYELENNDI